MMAMTMAMAKQQRSNWVDMLKFCCLSAHSDGTRRPPARSYGTHPPPALSDGTHPPPPPPPAHSDGTHRLRVLPKHIYEDMLNRWILEQNMLKRWRQELPGKLSLQKWKDEAKKLFMTNQPIPGYDIVQLEPYSIAFSPAPVIVDAAETQNPYFQEIKQKGRSVSDWEDMVNRWISYKLYGRPPKLSEADAVAWRMYEITRFFKSEGVNHLDKLTMEYVPPELFVCWLNELQGYVGSVELANELDLAGCLYELLHDVLGNDYPCIREKTAELVTTMVHNNPRSQQLVLSVGGLQSLLFILTSDPCPTSRTKALGAISALIRNNKPGITIFQLENGYAKLRDALSLENDVMLQREALNLIQYLLHENTPDYDTVTKLGLPHIMMHLASSDDAEVREAALRCLLVLVRDEEGRNNGQLVKNDDKLKQVLQERIEGISAMAREDLGAAREEKELVDSLWNACYNEPPSFGDKGLLVLVNEDSPAPDVANKQYKPPQRAWSGMEAADRNSVSQKRDCNIFTELGLPNVMIYLASSEDAEARKAALRYLIREIDEKGGNIGQLVKNDDTLKPFLQERIEEINAMAPEDQDAAREEINLVDSFWNACYNEPSSLMLFEPSQGLVSCGSC